MATNFTFSTSKRDVLAFVAIGLMFITLGVTNADNRLFVLAGVLFILSASITWHKVRKQHNNKVNDQ